MLKMNMEFSNNILTIKLEDNLNRNTTYKINNYLVPVILNHNIKNIVFDLKNLKTIDDDGIEALLNVKYAIKNNKGKIYISYISEEINKKIKKLHLKKLKEIKI